MKLNKKQVEKISFLILERLKSEGLIIFKAPEETVLARINKAITDDLLREEELDREIDGLIEAHSGSLAADGVDYRKMFNMIKHRLVRERDLIL